MLDDALASFGIGYTHSVALAGLRRRSETVADDVNGYRRNRSFQNYAVYALSETFHQGLAGLIELGRRHACAIMCAEAVWWRCHRRIIADHLLHHGEQVRHLMNHGRIQPATMTAAAHTGAHVELIYPAHS